MTQVVLLLLLAYVAFVCAPLVTHVSVNQFASTSTASLKLTVTLPSRGAVVEPPLPSVPSMLRIDGPTSWMGVVRRGFGVAVKKSLPFRSLSVAPPFLRKSAVVLLGAGALAVPS